MRVERKVLTAELDSSITMASDSSPASSSPPPTPLPSVLVLRELLPTFDATLSARFHLLKSYESLLPRDAFFASPAAASASAAIVSGSDSAVDAAFLDRLPHLRCVITTSAGVNHIDFNECTRRGIAVANAGTVFSVDVAEYAVGLLLDVLRRFSASERFLRGGIWSIKGDYPLGYKLGGKRVGIVGLGSIGSETAKRLEPFGCIISYFSRRQKPNVPYKYYYNIFNLASECDILVVSCALNSETRHIINKDVMQALGKEGIIINIGRGALIDEEELVRHLMKGEIGGAGLDVFENEPSVPKELFSMDNVVLSPHQAVCTSESFADLLQVIIENLDAFFSNKPLITQVFE